MTTPFGGQKSPFCIDLLPYQKGVAGNTAPTAISVASTTTADTNFGSMVDFSKITSGTFYIAIVWSYDNHAVISTNAVWLYDHTNSATLATMSVVASGGGNTFDTATSLFTTFTKPAGVARVGLKIQNGTSTLLFYIFDAKIWVI